MLLKKVRFVVVMGILIGSILLTLIYGKADVSSAVNDIMLYKSDSVTGRWGE